MTNCDLLLKKTIAIVVIGHILLISVACMQSLVFSQPKKKSFQKLTVQTVSLEAKDQQIIASHQPTTKKTSQSPQELKNTTSSSPINANEKKNPPPKPNQSKNSPAKPTPAKPLSPTTKSISPQNKEVKPQPLQRPASKPSSNTPQKDELAKKQATKSSPSMKKELLDKMKESMSKVKIPSLSIAKEAQNATPRAKMEALQTSTDIYQNGNTSYESAYKESLLSRLKSQLKMPEYGKVEIELTLAKDGKLIHFKVLKDESMKNRFYIEKTIPLIKFPPFSSISISEEKKTFILTLINDM